MVDFSNDPATNRLYLEAGKALASAFSAPLKAGVVNVLSALKGYDSYLQETHRKVSYFRSLLNPNLSLLTAEHYIPACFSHSSQI